MKNVSAVQLLQVGREIHQFVHLTHWCEPSEGKQYYYIINLPNN